VSQRQRILQELGLLPMWRLRTSAAQPTVDSPAAEADSIAVAAIETATSTPQPPAPRPEPAPTLAPAARVSDSNENGGDELPAWLDEEIPLPDLLPLQDDIDDIDLPPKAPAPSRETRIAALDWNQLQAEVAACRACDLCKTRSNTVFGVGDVQADWLIVGEAPGADEDQQGEPFVGQAGKLLDNMLKALDLQRGQGVFIANVLKCRPPQNRDPNPLETAQCEPYLLRQIELIKPKIIVAVGRIAAQSLLKSDAKIGSLRGKVHSYHGVPLIITYHPAYLLRNQPDKAKAWQDLCLARATHRSLG
jgi:uracil-DNA glycosylase family 4